MHNRRLVSFTLSELLIVLIVSSILFASVYYAYVTVNIYMTSYHHRVTEKSELLNFYSLMYADFSNANYAEQQGGVILLANGGEIIYYQISSTKITRTRNKTEAELSIKDLRYTPVIKENYSRLNYLSEISFHFLWGEKPIDWTFEVFYDHKVLNFNK